MVTYTFLNGTAANATEVNQNFKDVESLGVPQAQQAYELLKASGSIDNEDFVFADRFTSAAGVKSTVDTTNSTATFSTNKYTCKTGTILTTTIADSTASFGSGTQYTGAVVTVNRSCFLISVDRQTGDTSSTVSVFTAINGGGTNLGSATFSGNTATFSPALALSVGTVYITTHSGGASRNIYRDTTLPTAFPNSNANIDVTASFETSSTSTTQSYSTAVIRTQQYIYDASSTVIVKPTSISGSELVLSNFCKTNTLVYSGTGDGGNDTNTFTKTYSGGGSNAIGGIKILARNNVLLKKIRLPYYNATTSTATVKIYGNNKATISTYTTNTLSTGTADGVDDTSTFNGTWVAYGAETGLKGAWVRVNNSCFLKSVTKEASCTASTAYLVRNNVIIASQVFSGNTATFGTVTGQFLEKDGVYGILAGSAGGSYTARNISDNPGTVTFNADLAILNSTQYANGCVATYVNATTTSAQQTTAFYHMNITSFVTQTASAESTRYIDNVNFVLKGGTKYYITEDMSTYTNNTGDQYTCIVPVNTTDISFIGGCYSSSLTDQTTNFHNIYELITQNITGALTQITNVTVDISDGTTTLNAQPINSTVDISSLNGGQLKLTYNLSTTNSTFTPEIYGYGGILK